MFLYCSRDANYFVRLCVYVNAVTIYFWQATGWRCAARRPETHVHNMMGKLRARARYRLIFA